MPCVSHLMCTLNTTWPTWPMVSILNCDALASYVMQYHADVFKPLKGMWHEGCLLHIGYEVGGRVVLDVLFLPETFCGEYVTGWLTPYTICLRERSGTCLSRAVASAVCITWELWAVSWSTRRIWFAARRRSAARLRVVWSRPVS